MNYDEAKETLSDNQKVLTSQFELLKTISTLLNSRETHSNGRDLVIRALAISDIFGKVEREILNSLVRCSGLHP